MTALGCATVVSALIAVLHRNLIRAVVAYAVSSVCLAAIFFLLGCPDPGGRRGGGVRGMNYRISFGLILGVLFLALFMLVLGPAIGAGPQVPQAPTAVGEALWQGRTFEVILQGIMILAGVMSIILLIGPQRSREEPP